MRIRLSRCIPTRNTFLMCNSRCTKILAILGEFFYKQFSSEKSNSRIYENVSFLPKFSKSNSRKRKVILISTRMLVFSLGCEKSNSLCTRELSYSWGETYNSEEFLLPISTRFTLLSVQHGFRLRGALKKTEKLGLFDQPEGGGGLTESQLFVKFFQNQICLGTVHKCDETHTTQMRREYLINS